MYGAPAAGHFSPASLSSRGSDGPDSMVPARMRKPRQARALYEGRWILLILILGLSVTSFYFHILFLTLLFGAMLLFSLYFFRDPERIPPSDPTLAVSPAD